jgi:protein-L-isoaspartate(D-aspartate) O-methyltransferase
MPRHPAASGLAPPLRRAAVLGGLAFALSLIAHGAAAQDGAATDRAVGADRAARADDRADERARMVEEQIAARGVKDPRVLEAFREVPRHLFVPEAHQRLAYADQPLPIGEGQTISQPYIVAYMTELLNLEPGDRVLEVGTGSAYQAAIASQLADSVFTVEIIPGLAASAAERLRRLGYANVVARQGDGYFGWAEHAPFDAIVVTAAAGQIPPPLLQQLEPGGRMVIPVGGVFQVQHLVLVEKADDGRVTTRNLLPVRFVPLVGH